MSMTTRDGRGGLLAVDDIVVGMALPWRECRVSSICGEYVVLSPTNWTHALPDKDGLIKVKRRLWDRMSLWERKVEEVAA